VDPSSFSWALPASNTELPTQSIIASLGHQLAARLLHASDYLATTSRRSHFVSQLTSQIAYKS
jgi:hypothetical protein